jgi:hypothetical protein
MSLLQSVFKSLYEKNSVNLHMYLASCYKDNVGLGWRSFKLSRKVELYNVGPWLPSKRLAVDWRGWLAQVLSPMLHSAPLAATAAGRVWISAAKLASAREVGGWLGRPALPNLDLKSKYIQSN